MKRKKSSIPPVFKEYSMDQLYLFPQNLNEMIPENHLVRVVNDIITQMDISTITATYKGGGTSSYHPRMLLKVIVYAYTQKIYSSRQIAKALRENIHFMWISGNNQPEYRTINRFRSSRLKECIDQIFAEVIAFLVENKYVKLENYFLDGTIVEANANQYTWVWKKATTRYKESLQKKIIDLIAHIDTITNKENEEYGDADLEEMGEHAEITSEMLREKVKEVNEYLTKLLADESDDTPETKDKKKALKKAEKTLSRDYLPRMEKYETYEEISGNRNSFSKTDHDATFMRMKDDHMKNGQLKPAYNIQTGTENQFIVGYSLHQKTTDTSHMISHLEKVEGILGQLPKNIITDSGYGSEENYAYLTEKQVNGYVKFNYFHKEQTKKFKNDKYRIENLQYDKSKDEYICPAGKRMQYQYTNKYKTDNGYITSRRIYQCENCTGCELREHCHRSKYDRKIRVGFRLNRFKMKARKLLKSKKGKKLRAKRGIEIESVFGQIKHNSGFRRFSLRGIEKVNLEWGLISISHNMKKIFTHGMK